MENNWVGADQRGFAIMFTVRSELGALPYTTINNIKVTNNVIRHSPAGMCFSGRDDNGMGWGGADTIENNLFDDVNSRWGGDGRLFQITGGLQGANFNHNTAFQNGFIAAFDDGSSSNIHFTNNIFNVGQNLVGNGTGAGNPTIAAYMGGGSFKNNLVIGANPSSYPSTNFFPGSIGQVGFVNYAGQNYALVPSSPYKNVGTDGKDPGMPTATSSTTGTSSIPTGWVEIVAKHSQKCFDIVAWQGSEYQAGTPLEQWTCWGGWMQQFKLTPVAGGYEITTRASGYQLDVAWALTNDGASIIQYPFWGGSNEVFTFVDLGNGYYNIRPNNSGKCLDVTGVSNDDGAKVIQWTCWGGDNQQFKLVPTGN